MRVGAVRECILARDTKTVWWHLLHQEVAQIVNFMTTSGGWSAVDAIVQQICAVRMQLKTAIVKMTAFKCTDRSLQRTRTLENYQNPTLSWESRKRCHHQLQDWEPQEKRDLSHCKLYFQVSCQLFTFWGSFQNTNKMWEQWAFIAVCVLSSHWVRQIFE